MTTPLEQLFEALTPEQIDEGLFRVSEGDSNLPHIFGGQILAQSLNAAARTVPEERHAHSAHAYFLRSGNNRKPVDFFVDSLRDGGSFSTRSVVAKQDGKAIFHVSVSFKTPEESVQHQPEMPDNIPSPSSLENDLERRKVEGLSIDYAEHDPFSAFDIRTVGTLPDQFEKGEPAIQGLWFKTRGNALDSALMQQCMLAYASDMRLLCSALKPHGLRFWDTSLQTASLDHALWFHRSFNFDDWLYYDMVGPVAADARGLNFGRFYDSNGVLFASTAQEGLMRVRNV